MYSMAVTLGRFTIMTSRGEAPPVGRSLASTAAGFTEFIDEISYENQILQS
jgi:hypothetical protein